MTHHNPSEGRADILDRMAAAGARRKAANRHRPGGLEELGAAYTEMRVVAAEAGRFSVSRNDLAAAAGVSRAQLHNILSRLTSV